MLSWLSLHTRPGSCSCLPSAPALQFCGLTHIAIAADRPGLKLLATLAREASCESLCNAQLPLQTVRSLAEGGAARLQLEDWASESGLAQAASDAQRYQQSAGLDSRLSAVDLQCLLLLLRTRLKVHAARTYGEPHEPRARARLHAVLADWDQLIVLEGRLLGAPLPATLRWRGWSRRELGLQAPAVADFEAALAACHNPGASARVGAAATAPLRLVGFARCWCQPADPHVAHCAATSLLPAGCVTEGSAARLLAMQLVTGGGGPSWSKGRVQGPLDCAARALAHSRPWLPSHPWRLQKELLGNARAHTAGVLTRMDVPGDNQPADNSTGFSYIQDMMMFVPTCAACGRQSVQLKKCSSCHAVSYW